jgi:hypothetical protein
LIATNFTFESDQGSGGASRHTTSIEINAVTVLNTDTNNALAEHVVGPFQQIRVTFNGLVDASSISCSDFVLEEWVPGQGPGLSNNVSTICTAVDTTHVNDGYIDIGFTAPWGTPLAPYVGYRFGSIGQISDMANELVNVSSYFFYVD